MITVAELATRPLAPAPELAADGRPSTSILALDADSAAAASGTELDRVIAYLRSGLTISVAVSRASGAASPAGAHVAPPVARIAAAADVVLSARSFPWAVTVADPEVELARLTSAVAEHPVPALTLAWLLRGSALLPVPDALAMESAAYSMLLAGTEFRRWLASRNEPRSPDSLHRLEVTRTGNRLAVRLDRPHRRNAVDAAMRNALVEALLVAELDPQLEVEITGAGPSFSAGGDLDEFGRAGDVSIAHIVRLAASVGAAIDRIADRVTARVHGVCMGAGMELPAFAGHVVAAAGTQFALPEVPMGLIPGAGGTVSIPRRIGRQRTLWLALTARRLSADQALTWGLVDAIE